MLTMAVGTFAAGCAVALGPGYTIEKQEILVHFIPSPQPHLFIQADYRLRNTGNQPLTELELRLPGRRRFRIANPQARWDDSSLSFESDPGRRRNTLLTLPQPWGVSVRHELHLSVEILPPEQPSSTLGFTQDAFFLPAQGWAPELLPASGLFGTGGVPPGDWNLSVTVPRGFLVHASGDSPKKKARGDESTFRSAQKPRDRYPFVVAGRYSENRVDAGDQRIFVWSLAPQDAASIQNTSNSLIKAIRAYNSVFGPRTKDVRPLWVAECPQADTCFTQRDSAFERLTSLRDQPPAAEMASLDTAMVDLNARSRNLAAVAAPSLAAGWLGYGQNPGFYDQVPPLTAFPAFAAAVGREAVEGPAVREQIVKRLLSVIPASPDPHQPDAPPVLRAKSLLFFYALQDRYGKEVFRDALRHMLRARRGRGFSIVDLIAAFEEENHENVAEFVRLWMKHPGVPRDFRARYENSTASAISNSKENSP
jgi:hypothetical protein